MKRWLPVYLLGILVLSVIEPPHAVHAQPPGIGQPYKTGQQAVTASAVALPYMEVTASCIKAPSTNTSPAVIFVGFSSAVTTSTGYPLAADDSTCLAVRNMNQIYVVASGAGSNVAWLNTTP